VLVLLAVSAGAIAAPFISRSEPEAAVELLPAGDTERIALALLGESQAQPKAQWYWEREEKDYEHARESRWTVPHGTAPDGELPAELAALIAERYLVPIAEFEHRLIQEYRIVLAALRPTPVPGRRSSWGELAVRVVELRYVAGPAQRKHWAITDSSSIFRCDE